MAEFRVRPPRLGPFGYHQRATDSGARGTVEVSRRTSRAVRARPFGLAVDSSAVARRASTFHQGGSTRKRRRSSGRGNPARASAPSWSPPLQPTGEPPPLPCASCRSRDGRDRLTAPPNPAVRKGSWFIANTNRWFERGPHLGADRHAEGLTSATRSTTAPFLPRFQEHDRWAVAIDGPRPVVRASGESRSRATRP